MKVYIETITEFVYQKLQFRVWKKLKPNKYSKEPQTQEAWHKQIQKECISNLIPIPNLEDLELVATTILSIKGINAVQVNPIKGNGLVVYKNWP